MRASLPRVTSALLRTGWTLTGLVDATIADARPSADLDRLVRRRAEFGLPRDPNAALLLDFEGAPMTTEMLPVRLRLAKTTRVSIEANEEFCRGLLSVRYGTPNRPPYSRARLTGYSRLLQPWQRRCAEPVRSVVRLPSPGPVRPAANR